MPLPVPDVDLGGVAYTASGTLPVCVCVFTSQVASKMLSKFGARVVCAESGEKALAILKAQIERASTAAAAAAEAKGGLGGEVLDSEAGRAGAADGSGTVIGQEGLADGAAGSCSTGSAPEREKDGGQVESAIDLVFMDIQVRRDSH